MTLFPSFNALWWTLAVIGPFLWIPLYSRLVAEGWFSLLSIPMAPFNSQSTKGNETNKDVKMLLLNVLAMIFDRLRSMMLLLTSDPTTAATTKSIRTKSTPSRQRRNVTFSQHSDGSVKAIHHTFDPKQAPCRKDTVVAVTTRTPPPFRSTQSSPSSSHQPPPPPRQRPVDTPPPKSWHQRNNQQQQQQHNDDDDDENDDDPYNQLDASSSLTIVESPTTTISPRSRTLQVYQTSPFHSVSSRHLVAATTTNANNNINNNNNDCDRTIPLSVQYKKRKWRPNEYHATTTTGDSTIVIADDGQPPIKRRMPLKSTRYQSHRPLSSLLQKRQARETHVWTELHRKRPKPGHTTTTPTTPTTPALSNTNPNGTSSEQSSLYSVADGTVLPLTSHLATNDDLATATTDQPSQPAFSLGSSGVDAPRESTVTNGSNGTSNFSLGEAAPLGTVNGMGAQQDDDDATGPPSHPTMDGTKSLFSFNGTAPASTTNGTGGESAFSFGGTAPLATTNGTQPASFGGTAPPVTTNGTDSQHGVSFGGTAPPTTTNGAPSAFSFGGPAPPTTKNGTDAQPTVSFDEAAPPATANGAQSAFSFGGAVPPTSTNGTQSAFSFGGTAPPTSTNGTQSAFSFGGTVPPTSMNGTQSAFSFGGTAPPTSTNGTNAQPAFSFGGTKTNAAASNGPSITNTNFTFGGAPVAAGINDTTPTPIHAFDGSSTANGVAMPSFSGAPSLAFSAATLPGAAPRQGPAAARRRAARTSRHR